MVSWLKDKVEVKEAKIGGNIPYALYHIQNGSDGVSIHGNSNYNVPSKNDQTEKYFYS